MLISMKVQDTTSQQHQYPLISLEHVSLRLGDQAILSDVSCTIAHGEHTALVGVNGSGKSSLLRILSGELWPTRDHGVRSYSLNGLEQIVSPLLIKQAVRRVAPEMQERFLRLALPLTTFEFVASGLFDRDYAPVVLTEDQRLLVWDMLERLHLGGVAEKEARMLSHGTLRRAFIARALIAKPRLLALDEVTDGLDHTSHKLVLQLLDDAVDVGTTLLCVAHRIERLPTCIQQCFEVRDRQLFPIALPESSIATRPMLQHAASAPAADALIPVVALTNVSLTIDETNILHDIDLVVRKGEHLAIFGENGAGKTSLAGILDGTYLPSSGSVTRFGFTRRPALREIRERIITLSDALQVRHDWMVTVRDTVASGFSQSIGLISALDAQQQARLEELVDRFALRSLLERYVPQLSFGQRRRVLLARALVQQPEIFILDEIFDGLDRETRAMFEAELLALAQSGTALIVIAHVEKDIPPYVRRRIRMERGRIISADSLVQG